MGITEDKDGCAVARRHCLRVWQVGHPLSDRPQKFVLCLDSNCLGRGDKLEFIDLNQNQNFVILAIYKVKWGV